jgi:hypothetical protein
MIVTPLNVTFDVTKAIEYYSQLEADYQHLKWAMPEDFYYKTIRKIYGWSLLVPNEADETKPYSSAQGLEVLNRDNFKKTDAVFGFGEQVTEIFPTAFRMLIGASPPGTHFLPHIDGNADTVVRGWMPIITDPTIKWITEEGVADLQPGTAYLIDIAYEHEVINEGNTVGIALVFDVLREDIEKFKQINAVIK